jgi:prepilin-type processing-associated H-X9-DG protein
MCDRTAMRKPFSAVALVLALLFSAMAASQLVSVGKTNPYHFEYMAEVSPGANAEPPTIGVPATENYWSLKASMQQARAHMGVAVVNGKIYAIGGDEGTIWGNAITEWGHTSHVVNTTQEYDPATDAWVRRASMPTARANFGIAVYENKIYCIGGYAANVTYVDGHVDRTVYFDLGVNEVYDPATDTWATKAAMPTRRSPVTASVVDGKIYVLSLFADSINVVYDPSTDSWTTESSPPYELTGVLAVVEGKIYAIGRHPDSSGHFVQVYDMVTKSWAIRKRAPTPGYYAAAAVTSGVNAPKRIYLFEETATRIYDPDRDVWAVGASMPTARACASVSVINDTFYVVGGRSWHAIFMIAPEAHNEQYKPFLVSTTPEVTIVSPRNATYDSSDVFLNFTTSEPTFWMGYSLDGQTNMTISGNTNLTGLSEGSHSIIVSAEDIVGDIGSSTAVHFVIDAFKPNISILLPKNTIYNVTTLSLTFTLSEPVSWVAYRLDSQANVQIAGNTTLASLSNGAHNLTIYAQDTAGNIGVSETVYFSVEAPEPFPTTLVTVATAVSVAAVGIGLVVYSVKFKKRSAEP